MIHPKLDQKVIDFDNLKKYRMELVADDVFCCLGTTIKKAGSKEAFTRVDYNYVTQLAEITANKGASQFLVVSSMGADPSSLFFYNRVKGKMEEDIKKYGFETVHIIRPSLLLGEREEQRTGEEIASKIMKPISTLMVGPLEKYKPIQAETVAKALVNLAAQDIKGIHLHLSDDLEEVGSKQ